MLLLALESTGPACSAALLETGGGRADPVIAERTSEAPPRAAADALIPLIDTLLAEAGTSFAALRLIAVNPGPGSFTGVRTGVAAARALALATGVHVLPVTGLETLAHSVAGHPGALRIAAIDARRGAVYAQAFDDRLRPLGAPALLTPSDAAGGHPGPLLLIGSGAPLIRAALPEGAQAAVEPGRLDAGALGRCAALFLASGARPVPGFALRPLYLREPDAHPQRPWYAAQDRDPAPA